MTATAYEVSIEFKRDLLAGYSKKIYDFRIFRRGKEVKILYKSDPNYKAEKERLYKEGFVDMDYIFPRYVSNPEKINWFTYFANPIYFIVSKNTNLKVVDIYNVDTSNIHVGYRGEFHSKTGSPVYHELIEEGSKLIAVVIAEGKLDKEVEVYGRFGRYQSRGFGKYKAVISLVKEQI